MRKISSYFIAAAVGFALGHTGQYSYTRHFLDNIQSNEGTLRAKQVAMHASESVRDLIDVVGFYGMKLASDDYRLR